MSSISFSWIISLSEIFSSFVWFQGKCINRILFTIRAFSLGVSFMCIMSVRVAAPQAPFIPALPWPPSPASNPPITVPQGRHTALCPLSSKMKLLPMQHPLSTRASHEHPGALVYTRVYTPPPSSHQHPTHSTSRKNLRSVQWLTGRLGWTCIH